MHVMSSFLSAFFDALLEEGQEDAIHVEPLHVPHQDLLAVERHFKAVAARGEACAWIHMVIEVHLAQRRDCPFERPNVRQAALGEVHENERELHGEGLPLLGLRGAFVQLFQLPPKEVFIVASVGGFEDLGRLVKEPLDSLRTRCEAYSLGSFHRGRQPQP